MLPAAAALTVWTPAASTLAAHGARGFLQSRIKISLCGCMRAQGGIARTSDFQLGIAKRRNAHSSSRETIITAVRDMRPSVTPTTAITFGDSMRKMLPSIVVGCKAKSHICICNLPKSRQIQRDIASTSTRIRKIRHGDRSPAGDCVPQPPNACCAYRRVIATDSRLCAACVLRRISCLRARVARGATYLHW